MRHQENHINLNNSAYNVFITSTNKLVCINLNKDCIVCRPSDIMFLYDTKTNLHVKTNLESYEELHFTCKCIKFDDFTSDPMPDEGGEWGIFAKMINSENCVQLTKKSLSCYIPPNPCSRLDHNWY